jgi:cell division protein FtsI (penicillin-binding protein 3)
MLAQQLIEQRAMRGTVVLMEVETGDIKAIANLDNMNGEIYERTNHAIAGRFEPGSTFKLASLLALLDDGMTLDTRIEVGNGMMELPGGRMVRDDHTPEEPVLSLRRVFETSSNVGFARAVGMRFNEREREKEYTDYLASLGFAEPLGIGIAGEANPVLHRPTPEARRSGDWNRNSAAYLAYGYGLEISPLHTLALYNAVANGGKMVRPRLVKELRGLDPSDTQTFPVEVINPSIATPRTIKALQQSLEGVVEEGTARALQNPYYKVAAKTGTAQQGSYGGGAGQVYMATMVGYFPADNPKYSCIVSIWTRVGQGVYVYYGAALAGPVFKAVADRVYVTRWDWQPSVDETRPPTTRPPAIKGGLDRDVREVAERLDIQLGNTTQQSEWVSTSLGTDSVAITAVSRKTAAGTVPNVIGMGLKDALYAIESRGLKVDFAGRGRVVSQHPEAGAEVRHGATITITLR